jgi:NADPH:quinone reductase-like Zn-dependent oxidoreductase
MKAAAYDRYGAAEEVTWREMPAPRPRSREVLVRVEAAALNPKDVVIRNGKFRAFSGSHFPKQMGFDLVGRVIDLGWRVPTVYAAARVFGFYSGYRGQRGSIAELAAIPIEQIAPIATEVDAAEAAATPLAGSAALQALRDDARLVEGERVLIIGASGGVGAFAVQVARILGARVVGTASAANAELVGSLGAEHVIDHGARDPLETGPYDVVLDCHGKQRAARVATALNPRGRFVSLVPSRGILSDVIRGRLLFPSTQLTNVQPRSANLAQLATWIGTGQLTPVIDSTYSPDQLQAAMQRLETRHARGKVVIRVR